ncbi:MAG: peptide deformylase [Chthoniobacteraceae bacterium]
MVREIVKYGHPALRKKGAIITEIDDDLRQLVIDMLETMEEANGVGLAAQQVGVPLQLTVIDVTDIEDRPSTMSMDGKPVDLDKHMPLVLINPELELGPEKEAGTEGCLSFPEITAPIDRSLEVKVRAIDIDGQEIEFAATGLLARAVQHEFDHLQGVLFVDRMNTATRTSLSGKLKRLQRDG